MHANVASAAWVRAELTLPQRPGCQEDGGQRAERCGIARGDLRGHSLLSASGRNMDGLESAGLISYLCSQQRVLGKKMRFSYPEYFIPVFFYFSF